MPRITTALGLRSVFITTAGDLARRAVDMPAGGSKVQRVDAPTWPIPLPVPRQGVVTVAHDERKRR